MSKDDIERAISTHKGLADRALEKAKQHRGTRKGTLAFVIFQHQRKRIRQLEQLLQDEKELP